MDQGDLRAPVTTTRNQHNTSNNNQEGRPQSALASVRVTENNDSFKQITDGVGFHNISGKLGLTTVNSDSVSDTSNFCNISDSNVNGISEHELEANGKHAINSSKGPYPTSEGSTHCVLSGNSLDSDGYTNQEKNQFRVRNSYVRKTFALDSTDKTSVDLPTLDLTHNLPPLNQTITQGFGLKMVATSACQQLIYRSVPPRPLNFAFTDVLDNKTARLRSKTAPVSTNSPEEFVQRFKSRPTTRPKVVEFDGSAVSSKTKKSAIGAAFPTARAKVYIGHHKTSSTLQSSDPFVPRSPSSKLQLAPLAQVGHQPSMGFPVSTSSRNARTRTVISQGSGKKGANTARTYTRSADSSSGARPVKSSTSLKQSETTRSAEFITTVNRVDSPDADDHIHNPELLLTSSTDCDDLSALPRPKKVLPRRELPWVFRYKVKKGMNTLARIMASRPSHQNVLHSSYTFT